MIIDALIIVEGISDVAFLSSFIESEFVHTNGYTIPKEEVEFALKVSETKSIIVLTDSDDAGKTIRERINKLIPNVINVSLDIEKCNKKGKHGVAEATKEEVINKLAPYKSLESVDRGNLTTIDLYKLGLIGENSKKRRELVVKQLKLGICDSKKMIRRLNFLKIKINEIERVLNNGNK